VGFPPLFPPFLTPTNNLKEEKRKGGGGGEGEFNLFPEKVLCPGISVKEREKKKREEGREEFPGPPESSFSVSSIKDLPTSRGGEREGGRRGGERKNPTLCPLSCGPEKGAKWGEEGKERGNFFFRKREKKKGGKTDPS